MSSSPDQSARLPSAMLKAGKIDWIMESLTGRERDLGYNMVDSEEPLHIL